MCYGESENPEEHAVGKEVVEEKETNKFIISMEVWTMKRIVNMNRTTNW